MASSVVNALSTYACNYLIKFLIIVSLVIKLTSKDAIESTYVTSYSST